MVGWANIVFAQPTDSILPSENVLEEVVVKSRVPRRVFAPGKDGAVGLRGVTLSETPTLMGSNDPVSVMRTLPSVATNNDLQASFSVRGSSTGANLFESDGARIVKPLHMLGLYSMYNPAYYRRYEFRPGYIPATTSNVGAGYVGAYSMEDRVDTVTEGTVSVGLIESHGAIRVPVVKGKSSLAVGLRRSYLNYVYPKILRLGESYLNYYFTDVNVSSYTSFSDSKSLAVSLFYNQDCLNLESNRHGEKEGDFGWSNLAVSAKYMNGAMTLVLNYTRLSNKLKMDEGGKTLDIPSEYAQYTAKMYYGWKEFDFEGDLNYRNSSGQKNKALNAMVDNSCRAVDLNMAAMWRHTWSERLDLSAGIRLTAYHSGNYNTILPQPRLHVSYILPNAMTVSVSGGRYVMVDRLIEENNVGLPTDFVACANRQLRPLDNYSFDVGLRGYIPYIIAHFDVGLYYKRILNDTEYVGSLLEFANASYDPYVDILQGDGYAGGAYISLMRQIGKVRGRVSYNYGISRIRLERYGSGYIPTNHDRPHDLNVTVSYNPVTALTLSLNYTLASGTPYTKAKYGYMIAENLICEYFPHNSSRLPTYNRMDVAATWEFNKAGRLRHSVNVSVYNVLANHNVLFRYTNYSLDNGIVQKESVMKSVIPSVSYTLSF